MIQLKQLLVEFIVSTPFAQERLMLLLDEVWAEVAEIEKRRDY